MDVLRVGASSSQILWTGAIVGILTAGTVTLPIDRARPILLSRDVRTTGALRAPIPYRTATIAGIVVSSLRSPGAAVLCVWTVIAGLDMPAICALTAPTGSTRSLIARGSTTTIDVPRSNACCVRSISPSVIIKQASCVRTGSVFSTARIRSRWRASRIA